MHLRMMCQRVLRRAGFTYDRHLASAGKVVDLLTGSADGVGNLLSRPGRQSRTYPESSTPSGRNWSDPVRPNFGLNAPRAGIDGNSPGIGGILKS